MKTSKLELGELVQGHPILKNYQTTERCQCPVLVSANKKRIVDYKLRNKLSEYIDDLEFRRQICNSVYQNEETDEATDTF